MSFAAVFFSWYMWAGIIALPVLVLLSDIATWLRMPPGPTPLPFVGNKLPKNKPWIQFQEWSKKYGPIFTICRCLAKLLVFFFRDKASKSPGLRVEQLLIRYRLGVGRRPTLVISDPEIAVDLMEKRSNKYSSR